MLTANLLSKIRYSDMDVVHRILTGFPLIGPMPEVPLVEQRPPGEALLGADPVWLARTAEVARQNLIDHVSNTKVDDLLRNIHGTTTNEKTGEVSKGWADGPFTEEQISLILGDKMWIAARRFGVTQKEKTRQIDDFPEYFLNACTTVADKILVAGIDSIASHAKLWSDKILEARLHPDNLITVTLASRETLQGRVHEDYLKKDVKLVGKCIDLESAYKQCPVQPAHSRYGIFAIKNPDAGAVEFFFARALPFGATAAVHGFNRAAMALNHLLHENVGVPCTHYFDDFTVIVPETIGAASDEFTGKFLR